MAYTPNLVANFAKTPMVIAPVSLPATAKNVFNDQSNAVQLLPAMPDNRQAITSLVVEVPITLTAAGKLVLFLSSGVAGGSTFQIGSVQHNLLTVTATAAVPQIAFSYNGTTPLIVPEGYSLWIASTVAQPAGSLVAYGIGKLF